MKSPQPADLPCIQTVGSFPAESNLKRKLHSPAAVFYLTIAAVGEHTTWLSPLSPPHTVVNRKKFARTLMQSVSN